jgi:hypothetical protein
MDFIHSSKDDSNDEIPHHPQLWHFNRDHTRIITSANDWVIQIKDDQVVAAPKENADATILSYDPISRNIRINDLFLCVESDEDKSQLTVCDSDSAKSRWIFKTPEEAFPQEFGDNEKYYIASKDSHLVVEQTYTRQGYPLTTWIPDGSSGQLWYSDSHGRIRNDDYIIEAVDVVAIKYIIPDVPVGGIFVVSSSNYPDFQVTMTSELWHFRGSTNYFLADIPLEQSELVSTTRIEDDGFRGKQQWDLKGGQLVNGYQNRKLVIRDLNGSLIGVECKLEEETTAEFYLVPEAMIVSWINLVALKKKAISYVREEFLFYQKVAAFHINTIIGVSPEELITRANYFERSISGSVAIMKEKKKK